MPKKSNMLRALLTVVLFCLLSVASVSVLLSLRLVVYSEQIGVSWSLASVPFSAPIDEPGQHTSRTPLCVARALMRPSDVSPSHVCLHQETGLSPQARTFSRLWSFRGRLPSAGAPLLLYWTSHQKNIDKRWRSFAL